MRLRENTVFVLGAGFTKAFFPKAPLLVDDYGAKEILDRISSLRSASAILQADIEARPQGDIDLEGIPGTQYQTPESRPSLSQTSAHVERKARRAVGGKLRRYTLLGIPGT